jgi:hypothetical protein
MEIGNDTDNHGIYIDEIMVILLIPDSIIQNNTNTTNFQNMSSIQNTTNPQQITETQAKYLLE